MSLDSETEQSRPGSTGGKGLEGMRVVGGGVGG